jgi:phosphoglycolate phosphatase-like HAD superfamily hydrolase
MPWIETVLKRLSFSHDINYVISINDRTDLKPKPDPSSYKEAIKHLNADFTFILEDSNAGIAAAKAASAYTIGLTVNLLPGYKQQGADIYANNMNEVVKILEDLGQSNINHYKL